MIRPAKFVDVPRIVDLLCDMEPMTAYAGRASVSPEHAKKLIAGFVQRHGHTREGGTCLFVWEVAGVVQGFIAGMLSRIYNIGDKLAASDMFLHVVNGTSPLAWIKLIRAYIHWARSSPDMIEIGLTRTSAIPRSERLDSIFQRLGFEEFGRVFVRRVG